MNTGKLVKSSDEKLYHWNTQGGTTEWTLPKDWQNLASVKVYQLTDQGKTNEKTVAVSGGKISLTAEAETPYVVTKGSEKQISVKWSEGMHVVDAGFNGGQNTLKDNWAVSGTGKAEVEGTNNAMLRLTGDVKVSQKLTDLTAGKRYAIYVGVDNRTNSPAKITVTNGTKVLATNETGKSIAKNYIKAYGHNTYSNTEGGSSYFQNMYVWFVAPESGDVKVTLSHSGACDNTDHVYFDDVRVLENGYKGLTLNADGTLKTLTNDFEDNAQGIWPFVVSGSEGVEDNRIHLSELHAPFTQAGWDVKKMDDVLDGKWSVKANGLIQKGTLIYQTIPQNVKLEPGETYKVSFKYQSGSDDIYAIATGDGEYNASTVKLTNLKKALGEDGTAEFEITGSITGDSWFGIYSTSTAPDLQNTSDSAANFGGYKDFVLDDLKVEHVASAEHTKADAEAKLKEVKDTYDGKSGDYSAEVWTTYVNTVAEIEALIAKDKPDYTTAYNKAVALAEYRKNAPGDDSNDAYDVATDAYTVEAGSQQALSAAMRPGKPRPGRQCRHSLAHLLERQRSVRRYRLVSVQPERADDHRRSALHGPQWRRERERQDQEVQDYADAVRRHHQGRRHQWHVHHDQRCLAEGQVRRGQERHQGAHHRSRNRGTVRGRGEHVRLRCRAACHHGSRRAEHRGQGQQVRSAEPVR